MMKQKIQSTARNYQNENDYWQIRDFLREVYLLNDRHEYSWSLLRWDYWVWHVNMNIFHVPLEKVIHIWQVDGQIVAMLNPDGNGKAFFQIHPAYRSAELFSEMLEIAGVKLVNHKEDGMHDLLAWVNADDIFFKEILTRRGYSRSKYKAEHMRRRFFTLFLKTGTRSAPLAMRANCPPALGFRGRYFTPRSRMKNIRAGNGIRTCSAFPFIVAIWTLWLWHPMESLLPSALFGWMR
jgi:hypothetical protein